MKRVLVTGSNGFVGKHLVKKLKLSGLRVFEFDRATGNDVLDKKHFSNLRKIDTVFHLAAVVGYLNVKKNLIESYKINVLGTLNVLEFCRQQKAKLIFPSTYVYNPYYNNMIKKETDPIMPTNFYTYSKYLGELYCQLYARKFNTKVVIMRISNAYGPNQPRQYIIPFLLESAKKNKIVNLTHPEAKRDFIYIDDLVEAYVKISQIKIKPGEVFNIASGEAISLKKLVSLIKQFTGLHFKITYTNRLRTNEIMQNLIDNKKFCQTTGWKPSFSLNAGLKKIINP